MSGSAFLPEPVRTPSRLATSGAARARETPWSTPGPGIPAGGDTAPDMNFRLRGDAHPSTPRHSRAFVRCPWSIRWPRDRCAAITEGAGVTGVGDLRLRPATVARIFAGVATTWNDAAIAADNPGAALPATRIL